jgi:hypothetical protein
MGIIAFVPAYRRKHGRKSCLALFATAMQQARPGEREGTTHFWRRNRLVRRGVPRFLPRSSGRAKEEPPPNLAKCEAHSGRKGCSRYSHSPS